MSKAELWTMCECVMAALRRRLTRSQIDWLLQERRRAAYFEACLG